MSIDPKAVAEPMTSPTSDPAPNPHASADEVEAALADTKLAQVLPQHRNVLIRVGNAHPPDIDHPRHVARGIEQDVAEREVAMRHDAPGRSGR